MTLFGCLKFMVIYILRALNVVIYIYIYIYIYILRALNVVIYIT